MARMNHEKVNRGPWMRGVANPYRSALGMSRWRMKAKHPGTCAKCHGGIEAGQWILWGPDEPACHSWCKRDRLILIAARAREMRQP